MNKLRILLTSVLALAAGSALAAQSSVVMPIVGPMPMATHNSTYLNPAMMALLTNSAGASAPAEGTGAAAAAYQFWADTSSSAAIMRVYDGAQWLAQRSIDATNHLSATVFDIANAGTTGTTVNKLAKLTGAPSTAVILATTDTDGALGVVVAGAGTSGKAQIAVSGEAVCVFDGATTAGDWVTPSSTVAGDCHDAGASRPGSAQVIGRVLSTNGSGGTYAVALSNLSAGVAGPTGPATTAGFGLTCASGTCSYDPTQVGWGWRNPLINSGMVLDQANNGSAYTIAPLSGGGVSNYILDGWFAWESGSGPGLTAQQTQVRAGGINYAVRIQRASGAGSNTNPTGLGQNIETNNSVSLQGAPVSLLFKLRPGATFSPTGITVYVIWGTGVNQSSASMAAGSWTGWNSCNGTLPSSSWTNGSSTFASFYLSCSGASAIPTNVTQLGVAFSMAWVGGTPGASDYVDITDVELVRGANYTGANWIAERPSYSAMLAAAQRYYQIGTSNIASYGASGSTYNFDQRFPVQMVGTPTITATPSGQTNISTSSTANAATDHFSITAAPTTTGAYSETVTWSANARF
jgi:hypothetical protein